MDADQLASYVQREVSEPWNEWPGGCPGEIEAALLDAVLSIRARYGQPTTGVRRRVARWREQCGSSLDDLGRLAAAEPDELARLLKTRQQIAGRLKTVAVVEAASRLKSAGVLHARQVDPDSTSHRAAYVGVRGLGPVTWAYLTMLLGHPGIKADTWVLRFVERALGRGVRTAEAEQLVGEAANLLGRSFIDVDHAVWSHVRRPRRR